MEGGEIKVDVKTEKSDLYTRSIILYETFMDAVSSIESDYKPNSLEEIAKRTCSDNEKLTNSEMSWYLAGFAVGANLSLVAPKAEEEPKDFSDFVKKTANKKRKILDGCKEPPTET